MKRKIFATAMLLHLFAFPGHSGAADFVDGLHAYLKSDYATALEEWKPLAEQGNAMAQFFLGHMYHEGEGVLQNYETSSGWYRRAAEQGYAHAQYVLAEKHMQRQTGTPYDVAAAVKWYERAARQGHTSSQRTLSGHYMMGQGVPIDGEKAVMWLKKSIDNARSQSSLGNIYSRGIDENVRQDFVEAYKWYSIAAQNGSKGGAWERDKIAKKLTPAQINEAKKRADECLGRNYQNC